LCTSIDQPICTDAFVMCQSNASLIWGECFRSTVIFNRFSGGLAATANHQKATSFPTSCTYEALRSEQTEFHPLQAGGWVREFIKIILQFRLD
jgi:hypothetical protein